MFSSAVNLEEDFTQQSVVLWQLLTDFTRKGKNCRRRKLCVSATASCATVSIATELSLPFLCTVPYGGSLVEIQITCRCATEKSVPMLSVCIPC